MTKAKRFIHRWTCPTCRFEHVWDWPNHDRAIAGDRIVFDCEACAATSTFTWDGQAWKLTNL